MANFYSVVTKVIFGLGVTGSLFYIFTCKKYYGGLNRFEILLVVLVVLFSAVFLISGLAIDDILCRLAKDSGVKKTLDKKSKSADMKKTLDKENKSANLKNNSKTEKVVPWNGKTACEHCGKKISWDSKNCPYCGEENLNFGITI